jgi:hypothetical protein
MNTVDQLSGSIKGEKFLGAAELLLASKGRFFHAVTSSAELLQS